MSLPDDPFDGLFHQVSDGEWDRWEIGGLWKDGIPLKNGSFTSQARQSEVDWQALLGKGLNAASRAEICNVRYPQAVVKGGIWRSLKAESRNNTMKRILDETPASEIVDIIDCHV